MSHCIRRIPKPARLVKVVECIPMPEKPPALPAKCLDCGATAKTPRLPRGWKRHKEEVRCADCWHKLYILRAVAMPVASPLDTDWPTLRAAVRIAFQDVTKCCNWMVTELYARDIRRTDQPKLPAMPHVYLYPEARVKFPSLTPQSVASIEQSVQGKYRAARRDVVWTSNASLPTFRYPVPFPVHNQSWSPSIEEDVPIVSVRVGAERWRLRLKTGAQFRRQLESFRLLVRGEALPGELAIYEKGTALMIKMVAWLPRTVPAAPTGGIDARQILRVSTQPDCLLVAVNFKDSTLWRYNADHVKRWVAEHRRQVQRLADDQKFEQRPTPTFAARREAAGRKFRDRMSSAIHQMTAQLVGYAQRRHFKMVRYDDSDRTYCEQFPWFRLNALLAEKLDAAGIAFDASADAAPKTP